MTSEKELSVLDAVALYKELTDVESGFRQLKDVLAMRPIYHQYQAAGQSSQRDSTSSPTYPASVRLVASPMTSGTFR